LLCKKKRGFRYGAPIQFLIRRRCLLPFVVLALEGHAGDAYGVLTGVRPGVGSTVLLRSAPGFLHVLPHDLDGIARAVVGCDGIAAMAEDGSGDRFWAARVP
jgi:hypothetical protein